MKTVADDRLPVSTPVMPIASFFSFLAKFLLSPFTPKRRKPKARKAANRHAEPALGRRNAELRTARVSSPQPGRQIHV